MRDIEITSKPIFDTTEVEIEAITEKGKAFFASIFGPGATSVTIAKSAAIGFMKHAEANGMKTQDEQPRKKAPSALEAFVANIEASRELLDKIGRQLDDHLGVAPDNVNWGHATVAARLWAELDEIANWL